MNVEVLFFGQLEELAGCDRINVRDATDTLTVTRLVCNQYPALSGVKYLIAVNHEVVAGNIPLQDGAVVAFLPPYSGG